MNLGQLAQLIKSGGNASATCEACEKPFSCGATLTGCWCSEIKLSEETRTELRRSYRNCLCRECLEKAGQNSRDSQD